MELPIPIDGDGTEFYQVMRSLRDKYGLPIGMASDSPILDTRMYEAEYPDGHKAQLSANVVAENIFPKLIVSGTYMSYLSRSLVPKITYKRSSSKMISPQH